MKPPVMVHNCLSVAVTRGPPILAPRLDPRDAVQVLSHYDALDLAPLSNDREQDPAVRGAVRERCDPAKRAALVALRMADRPACG